MSPGRRAQYDLHEVTDDPDRFVLLEHWATAADLAAHAASAHMVEAAELAPSRRARPVDVLRLSASSLA